MLPACHLDVSTHSSILPDRKAIISFVTCPVVYTVAHEVPADMVGHVCWVHVSAMTP